MGVNNLIAFRSNTTKGFKHDSQNRLRSHMPQREEGGEP